MTKLVLLALAATVSALPAAASAQVVTSPGPVAGGTGGFQGGTFVGPHIQRGFFVPPIEQPDLGVGAAPRTGFRNWLRRVLGNERRSPPVPPPARRPERGLPPP